MISRAKKYVAVLLVFEDSLYALKTAKNAGFRAIGVYDADGETDQEGGRETGELYLTSLLDFRQYWMKHSSRTHVRLGA